MSFDLLMITSTTFYPASQFIKTKRRQLMLQIVRLELLYTYKQ